MKDITMIKNLILSTAITALSTLGAIAGNAVTKFDVAEDPTRFGFATMPAHEC